MTVERESKCQTSDVGFQNGANGMSDLAAAGVKLRRKQRVSEGNERVSIEEMDFGDRR